jgi:hypothetical protein
MKRTDLFSIVAVLALCLLLGLLFMKRRGRQEQESRRMVCVDNLKQIGLMTRIETRDFDRTLMSYPVDQEGSKEWVEAGELWRHYVLLFGGTESPRVLICPEDARVPATAWTNVVSNQQVSYFAGIDAQDTRPNMLLSGDRNIAINGQQLGGSVSLGTNAPVEWTANDIHRGEGNICHSDGHVQQFTTAELRGILANTGDVTNPTGVPLT